MLKVLQLFALVLLFTTLGHSQYAWRQLDEAPSSSSRHDDVFFLTPEVGWIANLQGHIYQTKNGGASWQRLYFNPNISFRSIGFADSLNGWAGTLTPPNILWRTFDGGTTWFAVPNIVGVKPEGICGISIVNDSTMYAVGRYDGPPILLKTSNKGMTWSTLNLQSYAGTLIDCHFFSPDSGFAVGGSNTGFFPNTLNAVVLFTSNGGLSWQVKKKTTRQGEWGWKISFPTRKTGFVSIEQWSSSAGDQYVLKTVDGGKTWQDIHVGSGFRLQGLGAVTENIGWVGGGLQTVETRDGGQSWQPAAINMRNVNRFRFFGDTLGYAVGREVFKYEKTMPVSVEEDPPLPENWSLAQNYPNPFNPSTTIDFSIGRQSLVRLSVFNVQGQLVATLVDKQMPSGSHRVTFTRDKLASGIYFYKIQAENFLETRKMILMR